MEEAKTFEQMLKAFNVIRKQIIDAKLHDITCVEINEFNDPSRNRSWININVIFGTGDNFVEGQCQMVCINDRNFKQGMETYKAALAERINQLNKQPIK